MEKKHQNEFQAHYYLKNMEDNSFETIKKKGHDGHFYECMVSDLGGRLLCCDCCPGTYHLRCLDPPLKRIPRGNWKCPTCCQNGDSHDETNYSGPMSKGARTNLTLEKSEIGNKLDDGTELPEHSESSIHRKKQSSGKEKPSPSRQVQFVEDKLESSFISKKGSPSCDGFGEGISILKVDNDEKHELSPTQRETKSMSLADGIFSHPTIMGSEKENADKSSASLHKNGSSSKKLVPEIDSAIQKSRKRKHKALIGGNQKKTRTDKKKNEANTTKNHGSNDICASPQTSEPHKHGKEVKRGASRSLLKGDNLMDVDIPLEDEVDMIMGCRLYNNATNILCHITPADTDEQPQKESIFSDNLNRMSETDQSCGTDSDAGAAENCTKTAPDDLSNSDVEKNKKISMGVDKIGKRKCALSTEDCAKVAENLSIRQNTEFSLRTHNDEFSTKCEMAISHETTEAKDTNMTSRTDLTCEKGKDPILPESASSKGATYTYEFLVKWVGKSHLHNSWILESKLQFLAKKKLDNYKKEHGMEEKNLLEAQWKQPQRVIALKSSKNGPDEVLVKWTALPYDECTWEKIDEPVIAKSSHIIDLFHQFECLMVEKDAAEHNISREKNDPQQNDILPLTEQPKELAGGELYPHQLEALNWLRKCWYESRNVILADEMGLGKTVSTSAFLSSLNFEFGARLPCLVLVPLSTMPNWMAEFALWAPNLNVVEYHGSAKARAMIRKYEWHASQPSGLNKKSASYKFNVLLTTYEMVINDSCHLRRIPWEVLVVDEGHRLKNSNSKLFSKLKEFSFQHCVLLTGTPIQNNIGEMHNLLYFLHPTLFPSLSLFEEKFNDLSNAKKVEELKKLIAPYMLRRLKKEVMQNIPPKSEQIVPVDLSSLQVECYRSVLTKKYEILRKIGNGVSQKSMLNVVMQLRKVCNHPYLIQGTEPESGSVEFLHEMRIKASAKLILLHSMLKVLCKEGHKVLIFSQMTTLLDILQDYLEIEFGPNTFERVDGSVSVSARQAAITHFNQDNSCFVFLLSTRSCGLGINLATADTVIIYDSDFNPHADIQAMSRAHRIGQVNRLMVYRFVVQASVEECILQLAKKKLMLDQLFSEKSVSQRELENILRWGTEELFSDSSSMGSKDTGENNGREQNVVACVEPKCRRRTGSLGDVYNNKCTDGSNKIVWDENAIQKLLDRLDHHSNIADKVDYAEVVSENDMLGSVKSLEWKGKTAKEHDRSRSLPTLTDDTCLQNYERQEDTLGAGEENPWDRLLRARWEKQQNEEEAALGRGKHVKKTVSYGDAYAPCPTITVSESDADEEPELENEYTKAGRAHKDKFAKLRARQKERLAHRNVNNTSGTIVGLPTQGPLFFPDVHALDNFKQTCVPLEALEHGPKRSKPDYYLPRQDKGKLVVPQTLALVQIPATHPDDLLGGEPRKEIFSEDELNSLWSGVRRHGQGNWNLMLQDPSLKFTRYRTAEDLHIRWMEEKHQILDLGALPVQEPFKPKSSAQSHQTYNWAWAIQHPALTRSSSFFPIR